MAQLVCRAAEASSAFIALQILDQVVGVLRTHRREHPRDRFLPAVLPVVVHADTRPWRSPRNVRGLFDLARLPKALHRYLPSLHYVLDDLHDVPPERLRRRALGRFGLRALGALQYLPPAARDERAFAAFLDAWHDIQEQAHRLGEARGGRDWFAAVPRRAVALRIATPRRFAGRSRRPTIRSFRT